MSATNDINTIIRDSDTCNSEPPNGVESVCNGNHDVSPSAAASSDDVTSHNTTNSTAQFVYMPYNVKRGAVELHSEAQSLSQHTCVQWREPHRLRFPQDAAALREQLDQQGAVVVNLFPELEATRTRDEIFASFAQHFGFGADPTAWEMNKEKKPAAFGGIYQAYGCAHFPAMWRLRTDRRLRALFAHLYDEQQLLVSMDTFKLNLPAEYHPCKPDMQKSTLHIDVPLQCADSSLRVYQGMINLSQQSPAAGGLFMGLGSHKHRFKNSEFTSGWLRYLKPDKFPFPLVSWYLRPGDVVVFDSGCVHGTQVCLPQLQRSTLGTAEDLRALSRVAAYVTYMPTSLGQRCGDVSDTWRKRNKALQERRGTNHIVYRLQQDGIDYGAMKVTSTKPRQGRKTISRDARLTLDEIRALCVERDCLHFIEESVNEELQGDPDSQNGTEQPSEVDTAANSGDEVDDEAADDEAPPAKRTRAD